MAVSLADFRPIHRHMQSEFGTPPGVEVAKVF